MDWSRRHRQRQRECSRLATQEQRSQRGQIGLRHYREGTRRPDRRAESTARRDRLIRCREARRGWCRSRSTPAQARRRITTSSDASFRLATTLVHVDAEGPAEAPAAPRSEQFQRSKDGKTVNVEQQQLMLLPLRRPNTVSNTLWRQPSNHTDCQATTGGSLSRRQPPAPAQWRAPMYCGGQHRASS